ncbi:MAG: lecithin retinol acyltransferase family protein [Myxococcota bacterium]|nr:lecithin retinol acyltransferase family protein [Myxococcota bacterium]
MFPLYSPGDHLRVDRGPYWHHGIYVGDGWMIHLSGLFGGKDAAEVQMCRFEDFVGTSGLAAVEVVEYGHADAVAVVFERARSQLGRVGYNLAQDNCEHFARWCKTGAVVSLKHPLI